VFRGPLIHVFPYPAAGDAAHPVLSKLIQVPSAAAERRTIERAFRGARVGGGVLVAVFGRKAIQTSGARWTCDVYDLQARQVQLTMSSRSVMEALERGVTPYAIIAPTYLLIRITRLDPYDFRAILVGVGQPTR
ncbi:MAG: hypothetical protein LC772_13135, partial [Chloroflexi bacterium]|nr:hypothetical protein [Chloroflexota bacterium]